MSGFGARWFLCGGWAVDAWIGHQTREHKDVDIAIFEDSQEAVLGHLAGWEIIAHDNRQPDDTERWTGRRLELPAHIHARTDDHDLDFQVCALLDGEWVLSREPGLSLPVNRATGRSLWGMPTVAPEVLLLYKARDMRPQDKIDFQALLPVLRENSAEWLRRAISIENADHPWLIRLSR
jgi:hypothetical protein